MTGTTCCPRLPTLLTRIPVIVTQTGQFPRRTSQALPAGSADGRVIVRGNTVQWNSLLTRPDRRE